MRFPAPFLRGRTWTGMIEGVWGGDFVNGICSDTTNLAG